MEFFIKVISSYPVAVFSVLLIVAFLYWLIACLGLVDMDSGMDADMDMDLDIPDGADAGDAGDSGGMAGPIAGLLLKLGLNGVPLTIVISLIALLSWVISYCGVIFFQDLMAGSAFIRYLFGTGILAGSFALGVFLTSILIRPIRKIILKSRQDAVTSRSLVGCPVTIRSEVGEHMGQAACFDGSSEHILLVRAGKPGQSFKRGDKAYLVEYHPDTNTYSVIGEEDFKNL